jgi:hypothetical protein
MNIYENDLNGCQFQIETKKLVYSGVLPWLLEPARYSANN